VISQIVNKSTIAGGCGSKLSGILAIYLIPYTIKPIGPMTWPRRNVWPVRLHCWLIYWSADRRLGNCNDEKLTLVNGEMEIVRIDLMMLMQLKGSQCVVKKVKRLFRWSVGSLTIIYCFVGEITPLVFIHISVSQILIALSSSKANHRLLNSVGKQLLWQLPPPRAFIIPELIRHSYRQMINNNCGQTLLTPG